MNNSKYKALKYIFIACLLVLSLDVFIQYQMVQRYRNDQILSVSLKTAALRARLEKELNGNFLLVQGLADFISLHPILDKDHYDQYCRGIMHKTSLLKSVGAAPDFVLSYIYPEKGNEQFFNTDFRLEKDCWEKINKINKNGKMVISGPVKLANGGLSFVGWAPVYIRTNEYFWGVVSGVIDLNSLLDASGIKEISAYQVAIRVLEGADDERPVFYGDADLFDSAAESVLMPVSLPFGAWQIAMIPNGGWRMFPPDSILIHGCLLLLAMVISFSIFKIVHKSNEVEGVKSKLSEAQAIAHLGNWNRNLVSGKMWWSNETYRIFGVEKDSFDPTSQGFMELVHPDDRDKVDACFSDAVTYCDPYEFEHRTVRPDGDIRYVRQQGRTAFDESGHPVRITGTVLDITERKLIEDELRESKIRFDHITKKLSNRFIFFSHTVYGEFISLSEGFEMLGYGSPESALGKRWTDVVSMTPEAFAQAMAHNEKVISGESETTEYEIAYLDPQGEERFLAIFGYMAFSYEMNEYVFEGVAIDITERRAKEERLKTLTRAIENAPVSVVITDTDGIITYVNPYFSLETGYSREEAIGQNPRVLKSGEHDEAFYKDMWATISDGKTWRGEIVNKKKDGSLFWEYASISPVYNSKGEIVSYVAVKEDINDKKELERLKADVDLIMRHDLKTPLNGIIGLPSLLYMDANLTDQQLDYLKVIEESGKNMLHMIDMSLDMFKMETGKYEYYPLKIDIMRIARRVVDHSFSKISARKVDVSVFLNGAKDTSDAELLVWGEERLVYSLLSGVLTNAIEASPFGENITIGFTEADNVVIKICNKGAVPLQVRECFFHKYVTKGKDNGTGLGTYSAKLMADTMYYGIDMETSDSRNETCINITIPSEKV